MRPVHHLSTGQLLSPSLYLRERLLVTDLYLLGSSRQSCRSTAPLPCLLATFCTASGLLRPSPNPTGFTSTASEGCTGMRLVGLSIAWWLRVWARM